MQVPVQVLNYPELMAVLRARVEAIGAPVALIEEHAHFTGGHLGKILGLAENKRLGLFAIWRLFEALGLRMCIAEHLDIPAVRDEMGAAFRPPALRAHRGKLRKRLSPALLSAVASELGRKGGSIRKRFRIDPITHGAINRANALKRWQRPKHRAAFVRQKTPGETAAVTAR